MDQRPKPKALQGWPEPDTLKTMSSIFLKPYRDRDGGRQHEHGAIVRNAARALRFVAAVLEGKAALFTGPRWRHKKRGSCYLEIGRGTLQQADMSVVITEGTELVAYCAEDGTLHFRRTEEFLDGRFEPMTPPMAGLPRSTDMSDHLISFLRSPAFPNLLSDVFRAGVCMMLADCFALTVAVALSVLGPSGARLRWWGGARVVLRRLRGLSLFGRGRLCGPGSHIDAVVPRGRQLHLAGAGNRPASGSRAVAAGMEGDGPAGQPFPAASLGYCRHP